MSTYVKMMTNTELKAGAAIFLDCDGVLLDVSDRYFRVHRASIAPSRGGGLDRSLFWSLKRARRPIGEILDADEAGHVDTTAYRARWIEKIEAQAFLAFDALFPGTREHLAALAHDHPLVLVTLRQRPGNLAAQLDLLGLRPFFHAVLVGSPLSPESWRVKAGLLRKSPWLRADALMVGDTEVDIRAGKEVGIKTIAVVSGIRNREVLQAQAPDAIIADLRALKEKGANLHTNNRDLTCRRFLQEAGAF